MKDFCFVIQPYDNGKYDKRYHEILKPTIESCGLISYRVDEDFRVDIPISAIESKILESALVIAEISTDRPNVWLELGLALARPKPIVLLCSDERKNPIPFDIRHRSILRYKTGSISDFQLLQKQLSENILARYERAVSTESTVTKEELFVLRFISGDQKNPFAITEEEQIIRNALSKHSVADNLRSLIKKGFLEFRYSTSGGKSFYHLTEKGEQFLSIN